MSERSDAIPAEEVRTGHSPEMIARAVVDQLFYLQGKLPETATRNDWYLALAYTVRDRMLERWIRTVRTLVRSEVKVVSYLSAEFLMGPQLVNNLINLSLEDEARAACEILGLDFDLLAAQEEEPGLGNGGLGRLAACYLDSLATLEVPAIGYGIRYEFGIFDQALRDGWQVEITDKWLHLGNPWEIARPEHNFKVGFGGHTEMWHDESGQYRMRWIPSRVIKGVAHDTPVPGYQVNTTNVLRLWRAEAVESFDFEAFNTGDYVGAVNQKIITENITKVLYPNDQTTAGRRLRLEQQYFFVSCSLQDMLEMHLGSGAPLQGFPDSFAIQLNDTHPAIAVAELQRLLVDEHLLDWEEAWEITQRTLGYTNHTLLPEALERWPLELFGSLLPRHLEIIHEINRRFLEEVRKRYPGDEARAQRLSLIDENGERQVRMAHLATVGSHTVNGVAALHTELLKRDVLREFHELAPEKFLNITNGVTPRRWVRLSNPRLSALIASRIGDDWLRHHEERLPQLEAFADDAGFQEEWRRVKAANKLDLAAIIKDRAAVGVDPASLFDVQVKRIHEYKRQHLNLLHVLSHYLRLKREPGVDLPPRTVILAGKAAPGYAMAKLIIKLINAAAEVINRDAETADRLRLIFLPDFNVKLAQSIYPAADLSEQISTAGKEASGTGNMKFALNGALTIGTLDGANVEIRDRVGAENFFLCGLNASEVRALKAGGYDPSAYYQRDPRLREVIDLIADGYFSGGDRALFRPLVEELLGRDEYLLLADYNSYLASQEEAGSVYRDLARWTRMTILNVARMSYFSSDRSIREYCERVWKARPVHVALD